MNQLSVLIKLDPEDNFSLGHLADTYLLLRDFDKVVELSDVVINRSAFLDTSYGNKGVALEAMRRFDDAMGCYIKSVEMNNDYLLGHMGKGSVFSKQGKDKEALECWNEVFRINQINLDQGYDMNKDERDWLYKVLSSRIELLQNFAELNEQVAAAKNARVCIDNNKLTDITTNVQNFIKVTNADMASSGSDMGLLQSDKMTLLIHGVMMNKSSSPTKIVDRINDLKAEISRQLDIIKVDGP